MRALKRKFIGKYDGQQELYHFEFVGLSSDTKPTNGVAEGSTFLEEDTSSVYIFNANKQWVEL